MATKTFSRHFLRLLSLIVILLAAATTLVSGDHHHEAQKSDDDNDDSIITLPDGSKRKSLYTLPKPCNETCSVEKMRSAQTNILVVSLDCVAIVIFGFIFGGIWNCIQNRRNPRRGEKETGPIRHY